jgi:hypothetical protein
VSRTIRRTFERSTKSATRFIERPEKGGERVIGQLDLPAEALRDLGDPDLLTVTITAGRGGGAVYIDPPENVITIP